MTGGYYLDFELKREEVARYGLALSTRCRWSSSPLSAGESIIHDRARAESAIRSTCAMRESYATTSSKLRRVLIPAMNGAQVPLGQLADVRFTSGPAMMQRIEDGQLAGYVFVDMTGRDIGGYVEEAQKKVAEQVRLPGRLYPCMERAIRIHTAREREADAMLCRLLY